MTAVSAIPITPPRIPLQTSLGPVEAIFWSPTSVVVFAEEPLVVNRVPVTFRVDIGIATNPHLIEDPSRPGLIAKHTSVRKQGDVWWEPSWALRDKVDGAVLEAVANHLEDPAFNASVKGEALARKVDQAYAKVEKARAAASEAEAEWFAASEEYAAHVSANA
jgi:hypothetical protein